ncbi:hypothetical protein ACFL2K_00585 [Candidatus Margulisiibacteriota bacterium]
MSSLQVRDLPEHIYRALFELAKKEHRSIAQEAIIILSKGLEVDLNPQQKRKNIINDIKSNWAELKKYNLPDPIDYIKEDRNR